MENIKEAAEQATLLQRERYNTNANHIIDAQYESGFRDGAKWQLNQPSTPPKKKLSELAEDEGTCKAIAELIGMEMITKRCDNSVFSMTLKYIDDHYVYELSIWEDGDMNLDNNTRSESCVITQCFQIVKLLLSAGYDIN